jgi:ELWxxDGT repeat protein
MGGTVFFTASTPATGRELWRTDGTAGGTQLVKDINPGAADALVDNLTPVDGVLYFLADDGVNGSALWRTDGTAAGTVLVKDIVPGPEASSIGDLIAFNGRLFFLATGAGGRELWQSDGTDAGTAVVRDIAPGAFDSDACCLAVFDDLLFFRAIDATVGAELWATDGTEAGTQVLSDIRPGPFGSFPFAMTPSAGALFFRARDGVTGLELWKTTPLASPIPRLRLAVNQESFVGGETLVVTATLVPGVGPPGPVDAYIVLALPDATVLSLRPDGSLVPGIQPVATAFFPAFFSGEVIRLVVPPGVPPAVLSWKAALLHAGTGVVVGPIAEEPFSIGP